MNGIEQSIEILKEMPLVITSLLGVVIAVISPVGAILKIIIGFVIVGTLGYVSKLIKSKK